MVPATMTYRIDFTQADFTGKVKLKLKYVFGFVFVKLILYRIIFVKIDFS